MNNNGIDEDPQFSECDVNLSDQNLEQDNSNGDSEVYAADDKINENNRDENFYTGKNKITK